MGLPSGTRWAPFNIGANAPEEFGQYFSWGNTEGHAEDSGYDFSEANYDGSPGASIQTDLPLANDMARANWGGKWKTPTSAQFSELIQYCNGGSWSTQNGVKGKLFKSNINGNTIFLPATGYYDGETNVGHGQSGGCWTDKLGNGQGIIAYFEQYRALTQNSNGRNCGYAVRAVIND